MTKEIEIQKESTNSIRQFRKLSLAMRNRSEESLKSRYKDYLVHINQKDLDTIFLFIEEHGI